MSKLTPDAIIEFLSKSSSPQTKRDIARELNVKGDNRRHLRNILKQLEKQHHIKRTDAKAYTIPDGLPDVLVLEISKIDSDGDVFAQPVEWTEPDKPKPEIEMKPLSSSAHAAYTIGARYLCRIKRHGAEFLATVIKSLDAPENKIIGLIAEHQGGFLLMPANKRERQDYIIEAQDLNNAKDGDLVSAEIQPVKHKHLKKKVRVIDVIGHEEDPKAISLIAAFEKNLRQDFPERVTQETEGLKVPPLGKREDLRKIPLVTIDGEDARDFDDAVFAEKMDDGGYHLIVAIADVAHYVRYNSALDREAYARGNSTYFPDRVIPMLPEALSNDLCSLRPKENRACMAMHMWIDANGKLLRYKPVRGLMRSAARLTYDQVQAALDGITDADTDALLDPVIRPLYDAFQILLKRREKRGALDLDLPETQIIVNQDGEMTGLRQRPRYDSHKLIEEFMVLANVAAARALEDKKSSCIYRIHDKPDPTKIDGIRDFIEGFGISFPKGQVITPERLNSVLIQAADTDFAFMVSQVVLRSQSQAVYSPHNKGHFGLALDKYAHFTSPIRRYADLYVHRALIKAYGLGDGGLTQDQEVQAEEICDSISLSERASMEAERSSVDRFTAQYLEQNIGAEFSGRISGLNKFGLFIRLDESGADGLVPIRSLPDDFYIHDEKQHALIGRRSGITFRMCAPVQVMLKEADGLTGSTILEVVNAENGAEIPGFKGKPIKKHGRSQKHQRHGKKPFKDRSKSHPNKKTKHRRKKGK